MHRLDQKPVVWNYLRLLMQRAAIYSVQGVAVTAPPAPAPSPSARPRVNVYLCIKQALFIRPMNMHCLVAVARCRVQTRRYHCLINHIQSHRLTLCRLPLLAAPFSPCSTRFSPFSALRSPLSPPLTRRGPAVSSRRTFRARSPSSCYLARFRLRGPPSRCSPLANRPQLTLIYVIFSGRPHVTALQCTLNQTCPMRVRSTRGKGSER